MYRKILACLAVLVLLSCCAPARAQDAADGIWAFRTNDGAYCLRLESIQADPGEITVVISGFGENCPMMEAAIFLKGKTYRTDSVDTGADGRYTYWFWNEKFDGTKPDAVFLYYQGTEEKRKLFWQDPDSDYLLTEPDKETAAAREGYGGTARKYAAVGFMPAWQLAERYGLESPGDLYVPARPAPLTAYMITHDECEIGINRDGMYPVNKKGIVAPLSDYLKEWAGDIVDESRGTVRFTDDPDEADILVSVRMKYLYHGKYSGAGITAEGYSCQVEWTAYSLSDPGVECSVSLLRTPPRSVSVSGGGKFWEDPPEFKGTEELSRFVKTIMQWYGYTAAIRSDGTGARAVRKALIARGLLQGEAAGVFDLDTANAVKKLQADYGLKETGWIDRLTLVALYYDDGTLRDMLQAYPLTRDEQ
ncbi:MAG: peptidoglycan-binding protein [Clostridia bacterium]|nr:peptidoglycan-binding protein [Clostridia bacterium]